MSKDFRSLLSTFQAATGTAAPNTTKPTTKSAVSISNSDDEDKKKEEKSLLELTTQLWQLSQLRQSTRPLTVAKNNTDEEDQEARQDRKRPSNLHLAICLCIVDDLPHEHIWRHWMESYRENEQQGLTPPTTTAELYLHAKHPDRIRTSWARSKLISVSHHPDWNDIRIVQSMLSLMSEALQDKRVTHIVFGTESCLPICLLKDIVTTLNANQSYVPYFDKRRASRFDERRCWNAVEPFVVSQAVHKALPGWCTLCRSHAQDILNLPDKYLEGKELWPAFRTCWAPEEVFFPTALALLGHLPTQTVCKSLTYAEWNFRAVDERERAHPRQWDDDWCADLVQDLRRDHDCLFLRKVKHPMSVQKWRDAVMPRQGDDTQLHSTRNARREKRPYGNTTHDNDRQRRRRRRRS